MHKSCFKLTDDWQFAVRKIDCPTRDFHVKFHARNRYRTNREVKRARESVARKRWLIFNNVEQRVLSKKYFYTQIKISIPAKFSVLKFFESIMSTSQNVFLAAEKPTVVPYCKLIDIFTWEKYILASTHYSFEELEHWKFSWYWNLNLSVKVFLT